MSNHKTPKKAVVTSARPAGKDHQVLTVEGGRKSYRKTPCPQCPWRVDAVGIFPPEAFRHSAGTAYDMAPHTFGCHDSGPKKPSVCAGFLLRGAEHNLAVRMGQVYGQFKNDVQDGGVDLHHDYVSMAIANGVPEDDPALQACRRRR